ncbi:hypothetical protein Tco_1151133 [Tanacetum coccineum]
MLHGNAVEVTSPVPETFRKRETPGNASETFLENRKRFMSTGSLTLSRKRLGNVSGPFKHVSGSIKRIHERLVLVVV